MSERVDLDRVAALDKAAREGRQEFAILCDSLGIESDDDLLAFYQTAAPAMARALKRIDTVTRAPIEDLDDAHHMRNEVLRALAVLDATGGDDG